MPITHKPWNFGYRRTLCAIACMSVMPVFACTVTATSLQFGTIDPLVAADTASTSTITVNCPAPTSYGIALSPGAGSFAERRITSGSSILSYNLYANASFTAIWGDGTASTSVVNGTADSTGTSHVVYGRVPHQPAAVPGAYADSIVVTVSF